MPEGNVKWFNCPAAWEWEWEGAVCHHPIPDSLPEPEPDPFFERVASEMQNPS